MRLAIYTLALLALAALLIATISHAMTRAERAECVGWLAEEKEYQAWYSAGWMKDQCKQFGITFTK